MIKAYNVVKRNHARAIFCPNQIAVSVAIGLVRRDEERMQATIFYWPDRCDISRLQVLGVKCLPYSRTACLAYLLKTNWRKRVEVLLPHRKLGRAVNWFSRFCHTISLIDDGLDTLRQVPRNVQPENFVAGANFYTFDYQNALGAWVNRFTVDRVGSLAALAEVSRSSIDLVNTKRLIIESPPLDRVREEIGLDDEGVILVSHSNVNKRSIQNFTGCSINGGEVALERSLREFSGEVVVGESMVAVFALMQRRPKYRLTIFLAKENIANLAPLIQLIHSHDFAHLKLC